MTAPCRVRVPGSAGYVEPATARRTRGGRRWVRGRCLEVNPRIARLAAVVWVLLSCTLASASPILVSRTPLPDPQVLQIDGEWFVFGTAAKPFLLHGDEL